MAKAIETGLPKMRIEEAAARRQARIDSGREVIVGVNKYRLPQEEPIDVLEVDNGAVRESQVRAPRHGAAHARRRGGADSAGVADERRGRRPGQSAGAGRRRGAGARHARRDFERARGRVRAIPGREPDDLRRLLVGESRAIRSSRRHGRWPSRLRRMRAGARASSWRRWGRTGTIAVRRSSPRAFADVGFDVDVGPLFQTPREAARMAAENDVHVLGVSSLAGGHKTLVPEAIAELKRLGRDDILVVVGGVVPPQDHEFLRAGGRGGGVRPGQRHPALRAADPHRPFRDDPCGLRVHRRFRDRANWNPSHRTFSSHDHRELERSGSLMLVGSRSIHLIMAFSPTSLPPCEINRRRE